ncbi:MAG TPA: glycoside hydrolase family 5 protein [Acidimicrobiales bacterium]|nr:glycoside hydrolase family 5 protein [Acidimicrobiales bacterium]
MVLRRIGTLGRRTRIGLVLGLVLGLSCGMALGVVASRGGGVLPAIGTERASASLAQNLLVGNQANFTTSTGGWVGSNSTLSWVASAGYSAPGALAMTSTGNQPMSAASGSPSAGGLVQATGGHVYAASAAVEAVTGSQAVETVIAFYNSSGTLVDAVFGPQSQAVTGSWTKATPVAALAPASTASVALSVEVTSTAAGDKVYLDDAWLHSAAGTSAGVVGPLHTSGNQIIDADGHPVVFRGVVLKGLEGSATGQGITEQSILEAKAWGSNFIRIPVGEQFWLSTNCDYNANYESTVDKVVNAVTSLGMVALIDLDFGTVGLPTTCTAGGPHNMADATQSPAFWTEVAQHYSSNPLVAFDLYNEPHNISDQVWLDGGTTTDTVTGTTYAAAGMQALYEAVRSTGAQNLVFISGNNWANSVPSTLVSGTNIVYATHVYTCPSTPPPSCASPDPYDPSQILDNWVALSASMPVMVTEFGWPSQSDGTYNSNVIAFANQHGWGWTSFAWEQLQYASAWDLTNAWLVDGTAEPSPSGMPVLCGLAEANSGFAVCDPPPTSAPIGGLAYNGLVPDRICDSRSASGSPSNQCTGRSLAGGSSLTVDIPAQVPTGSGAVVLNVTVVAGSGSQGYLTVYPAGQPQPTAANVTFTNGQVVDNLVTVGIGSDPSQSGAPAVTIFNGAPQGAAGTVDVVVDLEGYYAPSTGTPSGEYHPLEPSRIADTRCSPSCPSGESVPGPNASLSTLGAGRSVQVEASGVGGVPSSGVSAVVLNIAVTNATASSYATVWPTGSTQPLAANENWGAGETLSAKVVVELGNSGDVSVYNAAGSADFVIDVDGYFSSGSGTQGSLFSAVEPSRVIGSSSGAVGVPGGSEAVAQIGGIGTVPADATAVVLNVTDVPTTPNFLTVFPAGGSPPNAADVNYVPQDTFNVVCNASYGTLSSSGQIAVLNGPSQAGTAGVAADLFGYFAPA